MDAETASFLDPRAEYQVALQDGLLETQANHLTRERLTDLGGPADLNGGPEELAGLEANSNIIITMLAITIIMMLASISNSKESDDCRFLKVHAKQRRSRSGIVGEATCWGRVVTLAFSHLASVDACKKISLFFIAIGCC